MAVTDTDIGIVIVSWNYQSPEV